MRSLERRSSIVGGVLAVAAVVICSSVAIADPPGRVARLGFLSGAVSFRPATVDDWTAATLNYPMTTGDHLRSDATGRAALQLGSEAVYLASKTSLGILNLDDRVAQLRLVQGTLFVSVRDIDLPLGEVVKIDTPNGAVSLTARGSYRIEVSLDGDQTTVTVRHGEANVSTESGAFDVGDNQSLVLPALSAPRDLRASADADEWDDWCQRSEDRAEHVLAQMYVSRDVIGYEDLDGFGEWQTDAVEGPLWIPHVKTDWVPYRFGHWGWVDPWGWTWIDDAPWGFAPFHYGRWVTRRGQWAWSPGDFLDRPVYAPALVAFVASGADGHVSPGSDEPIAWFPLGPHERFVPAYQASPEYLQEINAAEATAADVNRTPETYVNRTVPGAMTAMPRDAFVQGRSVSGIKRN